MYGRIPRPWKYTPPKDKIKCETQKMFAVEPPYKGPRLNSAMLAMPVQPNVRYVRGLLAIAKPIPDNFSWRKDKERIEQAVRDQGLCGGCWAFSIVSALGDRYSIKYNIESPFPSSSWLIINGKPPSVPSFLECQTGGNTYQGSKWVEQYGVKLSSCWPYSIIRDKGQFVSPQQFYTRNYNSETGEYFLANKLYENCCYDCCSEDIVKNNKNLSLYIKPNSTKYVVAMNPKDGSINDIETTRAIQREIMEFGPVVAAFKVYGDFMKYWEGGAAAAGEIYIPKSKMNPNGNHAIVLTGWGTAPDPRNPSKKIRYWEMRNSWGQTGDKGFCKFAFSLDTPRQLWTCIDIPENYRGSWLGGVVAFLPADLPPKNNFTKISKTLKNVEKDQKPDNNKTDTDYTLYYIIGGVVIVLLILIIIFISMKSSVSTPPMIPKIELPQISSPNSSLVF